MSAALAFAMAKARTDVAEMTAEMERRWEVAEQSGRTEDYSDAENYADDCRVHFHELLNAILAAPAAPVEPDPPDCPDDGDTCYPGSEEGLWMCCSCGKEVRTG